jgi:MFS family permease
VRDPAARPRHRNHNAWHLVTRTIAHATLGGGSLLGVALAPRSLRRHAELMCITVGAFVMAMTIGAVSIAPVLAVAVGLMLAGGVADGIATVAEETLVQRRVPDAVRGRVLAAIEAAVLVSLALSFGFAGFLLDAVGPRMTYLVAGVVFAVGALLILRLVLQQRAERAEEADEQWAALTPR